MGNAGGKKALGPPPPRQPQGPVVIEIRQYPAFGFSVDRAGAEGKDRIVSFYHPDGVRRDYPLEEEAAKEMAHKLLSPGVEKANVVVPPGVDPNERTEDAD
jgi:hypothetical protein